MHIEEISSCQIQRKNNEKEKQLMWVSTKTILVATWIMFEDDLELLKNTIHGMRTPTGYGSSLRKSFITVDV